MNVQKTDVDVDSLFGFEPKSLHSEYNLEYVDQQVDKYIEDLNNAKRPVMMIGGGVRIAKAVDEFRELGRLLKIPCFPTWNALDAVSSDFEYYGGRIGTYGGAGRNFGIQNSDLLLAIGSRISGRITGGNINSFARESKKYVVDVDESLLQKYLQQIPLDINICCDAQIFIERFLVKVSNLNIKFPDFSDWTDKVMGWKKQYDPVKPEYYEQQDVHPYVFMRKLSKIMDNDAILIGDCGGNIVISNHSFETKHGQRNLTNNGNSPMGFSFAASMGAWFARPEAQIVCTIGDGGFNMNIQELQTVSNYNIKVKTFIINNHIYGITKAFQKTNFQGRSEACGPKGYSPPNFLKIVEAYGIKTFSITSNEMINEIVAKVLKFDGPVVCDVVCDEFHKYEPRIFGWKTPIEDMYPYLPREEFKKNMIVEPLEGWLDPEMPNIVD